MAGGEKTIVFISEVENMKRFIHCNKTGELVAEKWNLIFWAPVPKPQDKDFNLYLKI